LASLLFLIPIALSLAGLALLAFLWSVKSGQYDDLNGAPLRALSDDDIAVDTTENTAHQRNIFP
jgi:cbb3-type cytochrome oxidase maturation protein